jgi:hypothetical protein
LKLRLQDVEAQLQYSENRVIALERQQQMVGRIMVSQQNDLAKSQALLSQQVQALTAENSVLKAQVSRSQSFFANSTQPGGDEFGSLRRQSSTPQAVPTQEQLFRNSSPHQTRPLQNEALSPSFGKASLRRTDSAGVPSPGSVESDPRLPEGSSPRADPETANTLLRQECDRLRACWDAASGELKTAEHELLHVKDLYTSLDVENASLRRKLCTLEEHMESNAVLTRENSKSVENSIVLLESEKAAAHAEHQKALSEIQALQDVYNMLSGKYEELMMQFDQTKLKLQKTTAESETQVKLLTLRLKAAEDLVVQRDNLQAVFVKQVHLAL